MKRRRGTRERARGTMSNVLDLTPEQQFERERRRGDPFPPQPEWTDEALGALNDTKPARYDGREGEVRAPMFTPADEAAVSRFTRQVWALTRQGRFGEARRLAAQWGTPHGRPAAGSHPYPSPAGRDTQPLRRQTGPQPAAPRPYTPLAGSPAALVRLLPSIARHRPLPPMAPAPVRERRNAVARHRVDRLGDYPAYDGYGHAEQYAALMRRVALATGTHTEREDAGAWPEPATDAAGPVPARRGLAITAGERLPRRLPGATLTAGHPGTGRHAGPGTPDRPPADEPSAIDLWVLARVHDRLQNLPESRSA